MKHNFLPTSLRVRLLLMITVVIIPVFIILFNSIEELRQREEKNAYQNAMQVAKAVSQANWQLIEVTKLLSEVLARLSEVQKTDIAACNELFAELLQQYPHYNNIALANTQGDIIASGLPMEEELNVMDYLLFISAKENLQFTIGHHQISPINNKGILPFAQPVLDQLGRVQGVLLVSLKLKWLDQLIDSVELPPGSRVNILDRNGTIFARFPVGDEWVGHTVPEDTSVAKIINSQESEGILAGRGIDGTQRIYAYLSLKEQLSTDIYITVGIPRDYIFAAVNSTAQQRLLELCGLTFLAFGLCWLTSEVLFLRPIQSLVDTARKLGRGDLTARTGLPYQGEIGELAKVIDETATSLEKERKRLYTILDESPGNVWLLEQDYSIPFANKNFRKLFGEPGNRHCYEIMWHRSEPCEHCTSLQTLECMLPSNYEGTIYNGRTYEIHQRFFLDTDGSPKIIKIGLDVTEKKQLEREIFRLDRLNLVGEMAAGIAHEIRNPLTSVRGFLQMLKEKKECSGYLDYFNLMINELDRANGIINEYLSLARKVPANLQSCNLTKIIKELQPLIISDASEKEMNVVVDLTEVPDLQLNKQEINQLLLNLTRNAIDAMTPGQTLTISTSQSENAVLLKVQDQGSGIPQEVLDKLGTPFVTTKENGTGLGLAVCYGIAARHQATIEVNTGSQGTIFIIKFPLPA